MALLLVFACACDETADAQDAGPRDQAAGDMTRADAPAPDRALVDRGMPDSTRDGPIPACPGFAAPQKAGTGTAAAIT